MKKAYSSHPLKRWEEQKNAMRSKGIPFTVTITSRTSTIETANRKLIFTDKPLSMKQLSFIGQVVADVKRQTEGRNITYTDDKTKYFYLNMKKCKAGDVFGPVIQTDITAAYWTAAKKLGYISDDIYRKGIPKPEASKKEIDLTKYARLIALGSLATKKMKWHIQGDKEVQLPTERAETAAVWFSITRHIGELMVNAADFTAEGFYFFWVDAIITTPEVGEKIKHYFESHDYQTHSDNYEKMKVFKSGIHLINGSGDDKRVKPFSIPTRPKIF